MDSDCEETRGFPLVSLFLWREMPLFGAGPADGRDLHRHKLIQGHRLFSADFFDPTRFSGPAIRVAHMVGHIHRLEAMCRRPVASAAEATC